MRARSSSIFWGGAAAAAVLIGSLFSASPATAAGAARTRRAVPEAQTVHVPTGDDARVLAADLTAQARAGSTVPQIPVDHTGYDAAVLSDVNGHDTAVGYDVFSPYHSSSRELLLVHHGISEVIGRTTGEAPLGDRSAYGMAINDDGIVAGEAPCLCHRTPPGVPHSRAFRWSRSAGFTYPPLPADVDRAAAVDINDEGVILVNVTDSPSTANSGAWLWNPNVGSLEKLPDLGGGPATGLSLNNDGTVVGYARVPGGWRHAVRWGRGRHHRIRDLAPGPQDSVATDINEDGTIVGWEHSVGSHAMAWLHNGRRARDLGEGRAYAINDDDQVAGNIVLAHVVPDDGSVLNNGLPYIDATVATVFDLWNPARRVVLDREPFGDDQPTRLNHNGLVVNGAWFSGPAVLP